MADDKHAVVYSLSGLVHVRLWDGGTATFPKAHYPEDWGAAHEWAEGRGATTVEVIPPAGDQQPVTYVRVPQKDLDELEQARKDLWTMFDSKKTFSTLDLMNITQVIWRIANRRYPEVKS